MCRNGLFIDLYLGDDVFWSVCIRVCVCVCIHVSVYVCVCECIHVCVCLLKMKKKAKLPISDGKRPLNAKSRHLSSDRIVLMLHGCMRECMGGCMRWGLLDGLFFTRFSLYGQWR